MPASQAGRRGFESRLPLQEINILRTPQLRRSAPLAEAYITPSAFSSAFTAPLRRSNEARVYSLWRTSTECPIWSARSCGSTFDSPNRQACVRRMTWKLAHSRPTLFRLR